MLDHELLIDSSEVGETPLHKAAETTSVAVVKLLLDEGADINPKTDAKVKQTSSEECRNSHTTPSYREVHLARRVHLAA